MTRPTTLYLVLLALLVALLALPNAVRRRPLSDTTELGVVALEVVIVVQALALAATLIAGHRAREGVTTVGYLLVSVALLPLLLGADRTRWSPTRVVVAGVALAVVVVRMWSTWRA